MPIPDLDRLLQQITYPGDTPQESAVLRAWLARNGANFDRIEFDVHLGNGQEPDPSLLPQFQQLARRLTQKRVDAIVFVGPQPVLLEVKKRGSLGAMGQLLGYRLLYMAQYPNQPAPEMRLICQTVDEDVRWTLAGHGITVDVVEVPNIEGVNVTR